MPFPDNEQMNVDFVAAVEKMPVLYNHTLKEYSIRKEQDKAWRVLAARFNATGSECRLRWKNIRGAFTRYLRNIRNTESGVKKQYYLWEELQFLLPYTKSRSQSGHLEMIPLSESQHDVIKSENEEEDDSDKDQSFGRITNIRTTADTPESIPEETNPSPSSAFHWSNIRQRKDDEPLEKSVATYFQLKGNELQDVETAADLDFFKSLLPDVREFPPAKKRLFKRKVLEIIDELSEEDVSPKRSAVHGAHSSSSVH